MTYQYFIGIDIAKATFDACLIKEDAPLCHQKIDNSKGAIAVWLQGLKKQYKAGGKNTLFCMEHMGTYHSHLVDVLQKKRCVLWVESPLAIKRSLGLQRGKSDKVDSYRIAHFAALNHRKAKLFAPPRGAIQDLKALSTLRLRLQRAILQLQTPLKESSAFCKKGMSTYLESQCKGSVAALQKDLQQVEEEMRLIVKMDEHLKHLNDILVSVPGIGERLAIELLIVTDEFKKFDSAKKLACYCGIAPFEHTSGVSVRGKTRVSPIGNRQFKSLLHMPALSSIRAKGELQDYYLKKVAEGHPKMSVLNAIKNKLLQRAFACVRDDRRFDAEKKS